MSLKKYVHQDRIDYPAFFSKRYWLDWFLKSEQYYVRLFLIALRSEEFYSYVHANKFFKYYFRRKRNILGRKLGFFIHPNNFNLGLKIYHYGSIIIHPNARIGSNCTIHGNCCIGSKGSYPDYVPIIGDNVDIGQGAQVLGGITIANGVKIGAGAIVTKSILQEGVTVVGIPARII
jgi:serine O-acetyltransferase